MKSLKRHFTSFVVVLTAMPMKIGIALALLMFFCVLAVLSTVPIPVRAQVLPCPDPDVVGLWPMNEGAGSITKDLTLNHNDGVITGAQWVEGKFSSGLYFDGNDYINVGNGQSLNGLSNLTIEAWIKPSTESIEGITNIVDKYSDYGFMLLIYDGHLFGGFTRVFGLSGPFWWVKSFASIKANIWTYVAFTHQYWSSPTHAMKLYINGVEVPSEWSDQGLTGAGNSPVCFGIHSANLAASGYIGVLDEVRITKRALTAQEILDYYNSNTEHCIQNHPPLANAGPDQTVEANVQNGAEMTLDGSGSTDPDNDLLTYTWREEGNIISGPTNDPAAQVVLILGNHTIELTVEDGKGGIDADDILIKVVDNTPPALEVALNPSLLWPPNHKPVDIHATVTVSDICDPNPSVVLTSITSNEPDNGLGDGDKPNDIIGANFGMGDYDFQIRAERSGKGEGRTYEVIYTAIDASFKSITDTTTVIVPKSLSKLAYQNTWEEKPMSFDLFGNWPNPFNSQTMISYQLPAPSHVVLKIYNTLGQEIRWLVDTEQMAGIYTMCWDGKTEEGIESVSGIYILRMDACLTVGQSGGFVETRMLLLIR